MPIDVEAYMAGAIPPLSRGGSWLPNGENGLDRVSASGASSLSGNGYQASNSLSMTMARTPPSMHHTPGHHMGQVPTRNGSIISSGSQWPLVSPHDRSNYGMDGTSSVRSSDQKGLPTSIDMNKLKRDPVKHDGWLRSPSIEFDYSPSIPHSPVSISPTAYSGRQGDHRIPIPQRQHSNLSSPVHSPNSVASPSIAGSPYRKVNLEAPLKPTSSPYRKVMEIKEDKRSVDSVPTRPGLPRRHTHTHVHSSKPKKGHEEDLYRSAQLNNRLARLNLQIKDNRISELDKSPTEHGEKSLSPKTSHHRRHSTAGISESGSNDTASSHTPNEPHRHRARHLSSPHGEIPLVPLPSSASLPRRSSTTINKVPTRPKPKQASSSPLISSSQPRPFPSPSTNGSIASQSDLSRLHPDREIDTARSRISSMSKDLDRKPAGYISPLEEHFYDDDEAHPAFASRPYTPKTPESQYLSRSDSGSQVNRDGNSDNEQVQFPTPKKNYMPPGFAKPTREVKWNREGPAMRTHGIAWLREGDPNNLPTSPKGPRYIIARPPNIDHNSTNADKWWSTGVGGDISYNTQQCFVPR
ncbi:uncharacterized protein L201_000674 [Kwoniella dendrophila CBS 6074]|uniref:Uncharacterized protein n=1 Tax=Kwoniella dendrophila CBS 6074 TaxID=1295534 RepID=A0AAX4JK73_9TREE